MFIKGATKGTDPGIIGIIGGSVAAGMFVVVLLLVNAIILLCILKKRLFHTKRLANN